MNRLDPDHSGKVESKELAHEIIARRGENNEVPSDLGEKYEHAIDRHQKVLEREIEIKYKEYDRRKEDEVLGATPNLAASNSDPHPYTPPPLRSDPPPHPTGPRSHLEALHASRRLHG